MWILAAVYPGEGQGQEDGKRVHSAIIPGPVKLVYKDMGEGQGDIKPVKKICASARFLGE